MPISIENAIKKDVFPVSLENQVRKYPTPFMLTDLSVVKSNVDHFRDLLPSVEMYYAIKANSDVPVVRAVDALVDGYDIASLGELKQLMKLGVTPERIMYSNPVKLPNHIKSAYQAGVRYFAFDSINEIEKLAKYAPGSTLYLRLKTSDYGSKFPLSRKFGLDPSYAIDYCSLAKDAGLNVKGLTFHVGSQSENLQVWKTALSMVGKTITALHKKGIDINFVDIGGGFPSDYGQPAPSLQDVARQIDEGVRQYLPKDIRVVAEPGRYVVANAALMGATIIGREHRGGSDWLYLDMGAFQGLIEPLEMPEMKYPIWTAKTGTGSHKTFVLSGPSCDAYDTIGMDYVLPADLSMGDRIYIGSTGAYTTVYASHFNGFAPPRKYYINAA